MQAPLEKYSISNENGLDDIIFLLSPGDRIFFYGDLGAGKTTFIRKLIRSYCKDDTMIVRSPTYTYYQEYHSGYLQYPIYHFDLYRLEEIDTFFSIGGMELIENPDAILLIEWPEILGDTVKPTKKITITKGEGDERIIEISRYVR